MNTNCDEWCRIECGECKWFNVKADLVGIESTCKRLDHKHLRFAKKIFKSYDCGQFDTQTCSDFEPNERKVPWLYNHWNEVKEQIVPYKDKDVVLLNIDGDTSVRWAVKATEFYDNMFLNPDGSLRWVYKYYSVPCRNSWSKQKTVYEFSDGTKVDGWESALQYCSKLLGRRLEIIKGGEQSMTNKQWLDDISHIDLLVTLLKHTSGCPLYLLGKNFSSTRCNKFSAVNDPAMYQTCYNCMCAWLDEERSE